MYGRPKKSSDTTYVPPSSDVLTDMRSPPQRTGLVLNLMREVLEPPLASTSESVRRRCAA
jgi:hypothetical protein